MGTMFYWELKCSLSPCHSKSILYGSTVGRLASTLLKKGCNNVMRPENKKMVDILATAKLAFYLASTNSSGSRW